MRQACPMCKWTRAVSQSILRKCYPRKDGRFNVIQFISGKASPERLPVVRFCGEGSSRSKYENLG